MHVLICGAGVIGASTAYFLAARGARVTVVERTGVGHAASGKSGGFLALDWCRGSALDALARRSFALHAELADGLRDEFGLEWGYRRLRTLHVDARAGNAAGGTADVPWLGPSARVHGILGTPETTAQLDPGAFTRALMQAAVAHGAELLEGVVEGIRLSDDGRRATGVVVDGTAQPADAVVVALGPWSVLACRWLPLPAVYGLKGHSLVFDYDPQGEPAALFVEAEAADGLRGDPEIVPRADGTTYVCGLSSQEALPLDPAQVEPEAGAPDRLRALTNVVSPQLASAEILARQACFRPITQDGLPLIGAVPGVEAAYVATGHSVWGMLNGPATGEAMAELILGGATTVDLTPFAPSRLPALDPEDLEG